MSSNEPQPEAPYVDAVLRGDEAAVRSWLERGGRANTAREDGEVIGVTLLMDAASQGHERVAALLLQHGAEIDQQDSGGSTALTSAAYNGHERVVELLLRHGVKVNVQDSNGFTALMGAAASGHERVVELLIRHGAEIDKQDGIGGTALMGAAYYGHERVVDMLCFSVARRSTCRRATASPR